MDKVHFSTGKDDWGTPQDLFDALNKEFGFTLDPCADDNNHKCAKYYTVEQDGLAQSWAGKRYFVTRRIAGKQNQMPVKLHGWKSAIKRRRGDHRGYADTRPHRYKNVSRFHFRQSRNTVYQGAA